MEGIGSEVSLKIRAAIKAKLIELGAYVDDELPDYIMVMVANKRTKSQMDEDLQLFLSSNTKIFTTWLHTVLQKLQEVTVANFESKKEDTKKKKRKDTDEGARSRKSSEDGTSKSKKHSKKHKEKKAKKNKHKSKDRLKFKKKDVEKKGEREETKTSQDKLSKSKKLQLNDAVGKAILGNLKNKKLKDETSCESSSSSSEDGSNEEEKKEKMNKNEVDSSKQKMAYGDEDVLNIKVDDEPDGRDMMVTKKDGNELIEDEFNIEPLKPSEKLEDLNEGEKQRKESCTAEIQVVTNVSAPTEELLKQHNKIQNEKIEVERKNREEKSESEDSISPEEMRKQLLLSRAKKKLEESKLAERMKSNSPDVLVLDESSLKGKHLPSSKTKAEAQYSRSRSRSGSPNRRSGKQSRTYSSDRKSSSPAKKGPGNEEKRRNASKSDRNISVERDTGSRKADDDRRKNLGKTSDSVEKERSLDHKKETDKKSKEKDAVSRRKALSSRVVTISGPEAPEIPSIVKVKPREFISKDKQANKALILKAVADAEKSIATVHTRVEPEPESKKKEALFTKNLRGKRFEKLAVTLSNIRKSPDSRDRTERRVSVDSEKSERSRLKHDSSDFSESIRAKTELCSKKLSKSEDQFISSKTTIMEKNEKYIRCWLEGVEKAVKQDEMVNPSEMEDFVHSNVTDDENDFTGRESFKKEEDRKRKRQTSDEVFGEQPTKNKKLTDKEIASLRVIPNSTSSDQGPQIVVTLDGLNSKTIKDLILKNKETSYKPLISSGKKEKTPERKTTFEKISDRFGRLNKVNEDDRNLRTEKDKKEKVSTESKNRQLIAQLSEKFGKIDREFENRKRKRLEDDRRYEARRGEKSDERNGKYRRSDRRSIREGGFGFYRRS